MRTTITEKVYECDLCKTRLKDDKYLVYVQAQGLVYDEEGKSCKIGAVQLDLCSNCQKRYYEHTKKFMDVKQMRSGVEVIYNG